MKSILDIATKANSYEVIAYDSIQDIALMEQVFKENNEYPYILATNLKYENKSYCFDTRARFENLYFAYEIYKNVIKERNHIKKEGTI